MSYRKEKLEEQIRRIIADLLLKEIKDPRIGFATLTGVELSKDYAQANIGISVLGDPRAMRKTLEGLQSAAPYIQHRVGKSLGIRVTPRITFYLDSSVADATEMVDLLNRLEESEAKKEESHEGDEGNVDDADGK